MEIISELFAPRQKCKLNDAMIHYFPFLFSFRPSRGRSKWSGSEWPIWKVWPRNFCLNSTRAPTRTTAAAAGTPSKKSWNSFKTGKKQTSLLLRLKINKRTEKKLSIESRAIVSGVRASSRISSGPSNLRKVEWMEEEENETHEPGRSK